MDQAVIRRRKLLYIGLPFLLLVLYLVLIPVPSVNRIYIQGNLAFLAEGYDFTILRISPRDRITRLSSVTFGFTVSDLAVASSYAYVITSEGVVHILDIVDPSNPKRLVEFATAGVPESIAVSGTTFFIADQIGNLHILNVDRPTSPFRKGVISDLDEVSDVAVAGNFVYVARGGQGLDIYDISNLAEPLRLGQYNPGRYIQKVTLQKITSPNGGETTNGILILDENVVQIVDLANPQQPLLLNSFDFGREKIEQVQMRDRNLLVAQRRGGLLISRINNAGQLDEPVKITASRNILGFARIDDTVYLATGFDGLQVFDMTELDSIYRAGAGYSRSWGHKLRITLSVMIFLLLWLGFFSQFVLPVRTFYQRQKIFDRLILFLLGKHGPAIFVQNGRKIERSGESERKGPGVIWMDTASAGVIRTATKFKEAIGPGVHFTKKGESLAGPIDLHTQVDSLGPFEEDKPFEKRTDDQSEEAYKQVQNRRKMTSALTRDGIEVIPNIRIVFRVNTEPATGDESGSRFGYRTGILRREKEKEEKDKESIFRAISGEGIDPTMPGDTPRHRIAWNQLPGRLAVDVWREYVAKFTLDELFIPTREFPSKPLLPPASNPQETKSQNGQVHAAETIKATRSDLTEMLHVINDLITRFADWVEGKKPDAAETPKDDIEAGTAPITNDNSETRKQTALQVINQMVKNRLTQPEVEILDNSGTPKPGTIHSREYDLLCERGLKVVSVSVSNLRFNEFVERHLIEQWKANWYNNAKAEREQIERHRRYVELRGEEEGITEYVHGLARHIVSRKPANIREMLRALLMCTRLTIVRDNQLQYRMSAERQDIEELLQWVENNT